MQTKVFVNVFGIKNATLKSMKIFKIITCFYLTTSTLLAHNEISFAQLDDMQKQIHVQLCRQSTIDRTKGEHTKNYFSAALLVRFTDNLTQTIYLNNLDETPYFASENKNDSGYTELHATLKQGFNEGLLSNFINRDVSNVFEKYRLNDSEMHFLAKIYFKNKENTNELLEKIQTKTEKIKEIEVHGFSTRDMCPCCYQHIKNYFLNQNPFLQDSLKLPIVKIFISSLVRFSIDQQEYTFSKYSYCYEPLQTINSIIEANKLHCIFLRDMPEIYIDPIDANRLNKNCLKKCSLIFQNYFEYPNKQKKLFKRDYTKKDPHLVKEDLHEKDMMKHKNQDLQKKRKIKETLYFTDEDD